MVCLYIYIYTIQYIDLYISTEISGQSSALNSLFCGDFCDYLQIWCFALKEKIQTKPSQKVNKHLNQIPEPNPNYAKPEIHVTRQMSSNGSIRTSINRDRIQQLHKRLHDNIKVKKEEDPPSLHTISSGDNSDSQRVRRNVIKTYLGEPLPLPYLIAHPQEPQIHLKQNNNSSSTRVDFKPRRDNKKLFQKKTEARLKLPLIRMRGDNMVDQSVQTDESTMASSHNRDMIIIANEEQIKRIIEEFHQLNGKDQNQPTKSTISRDILSSSSILIVLLVVLYSVVYLLKIRLL